MLKTTLQKILDHKPCGQEKGCGKGWDHLLMGLGEAFDAPDLSREVTILEIIETNGVKDAFWALRAVDDRKTVTLIKCDCAESVLTIFEKQHPQDNRPRAAIETAREWARGKATEDERRKAAAAAANAAAAAREQQWKKNEEILRKYL